MKKLLVATALIIGSVVQAEPDSFDVAYTWETVKDLSASVDGSVIDICLE